MSEFLVGILTPVFEGARWIQHAFLMLQLGIVVGTATVALLGVHVAQRSAVDVSFKDSILLGAAGGAWGGAFGVGTFAWLTLRENDMPWFEVAIFGLAVGLVQGALLGPPAVWLGLFWKAARSECVMRARRAGQLTR